MNMKEFVNAPNMEIFIPSLRKTGYDTYTAIADIVDNSIDAGARIINIAVNGSYIIISDNGTGMSEDTLTQALKYGSKSDKTDQKQDLGKYGMGLCTASISIARRIEVITCNKSGIHRYGIQDIDRMAETNSFSMSTGEANDAHEALFRGMIKSETGTLIKLTNLDLLTHKPNTIEKNLHIHLGRVFRKFLQKNVININGNKISAIDPMQGVLGLQKIDIEYGEIKSSITIKLGLIPYAGQGKKAVTDGLGSQGFYIMRNNREIENSTWLNIVSNHPHLNRIRGEIYFNSELDSQFGVTFSKRGVKLNQSMFDTLQSNVKNIIKTLENQTRLESTTSKENKLDHEDIIKNIRKKGKLLITPEGDIEKRTSTKRKESGLPKKKHQGGTRNPSTIQTGHIIDAEFVTENLGVCGALFECAVKGNKTMIILNAQHPFYERVYLKYKDNRDLIESVDAMIYSLATAELSELDDKARKILGGHKIKMSMNLGTLMD